MVNKCLTTKFLMKMKKIIIVMGILSVIFHANAKGNNEMVSNLADSYTTGIEAEYQFMEIQGLDYICTDDTIDFSLSDIPENVVVYNSGIKLDSSKYDYSDNDLTVNNVTGDLVIKKMEIGTYSKTLICVIYLNSKVNKKIHERIYKDIFISIHHLRKLTKSFPV